MNCVCEAVQKSNHCKRSFVVGGKAVINSETSSQGRMGLPCRLEKNITSKQYTLEDERPESTLQHYQR